MSHGKKFTLSGIFGKKVAVSGTVARTRKLRLEHLENRELLSASTFDDASFINAVTSSAAYVASSSEVAPIDLSNAESEVVVTTLADYGAGSLRQAIRDVPTGGRITFAVSGTIQLNDTLTINKTITIDASSVKSSSGAPGIVLDGHGCYAPIFTVTGGAGSSAAPVTFIGLRATNNRSAEDGSAFYFNSGTTIL